MSIKSFSTLASFLSESISCSEHVNNIHMRFQKMKEESSAPNGAAVSSTCLHSKLSVGHSLPAL